MYYISAPLIYLLLLSTLYPVTAQQLPPVDGDMSAKLAELFAASNFSKEYKGSKHFFNLVGEWENVAPRAKKVSKLHITSTIVNSYRVQPFFMIGTKVMPFPKQIPLTVSEEHLAYIAHLNATTIRVMPMKINGKDMLKVYYFVVDPEGQWTGLEMDVLVRKNSVPEAAPAGFGVESFHNHWKNEWTENEMLARSFIYKKDGSTYVKPYKIKGGKPRLWGNKEQRATYDPNTLTLTTKMIGSGLTTKMTYHPIFEHGEMAGMDVIIEEIYSDGAPKQLTRQFLIPDSEGANEEWAERTIASIEGDWYNFDPNARTKRFNIDRGDMSLWVNCVEKGGCGIGNRPVKRIGNMVGPTFKTLTTIRTVEIETDLEVNRLSSKPQYLVINTTIEDMEGFKPPIKYTEVFKRTKTKKRTKTQMYKRKKPRAVAKKSSNAVPASALPPPPPDDEADTYPWKSKTQKVGSGVAPVSTPMPSSTVTPQPPKVGKYPWEK